MINFKKIKKIEDYQLEELQNKKLYINIYNLDLKYTYELMADYKTFYFDVLNELTTKTSINIDKLVDLCILPYDYYIKKYNLKIDIRDYINITDYIDFEEWQQRTGNQLVLTPRGQFIAQEM